MRELGFTKTVVVEGRSSIADLFPASKSRCGIYMLEFADQTRYIGKAIDVVRRYGQHRRIHPNIVRLSFQPTKQKALLEVEERLITTAERMGLVLTNIVHAATIHGETDLDALISREEQERWLVNPARLLPTPERTVIDGQEQHRLRYQRQFSLFQQHPSSEQIVAAVKLYVDACVLAPSLTEYSFWAVSCMPSTNGPSVPRLACINVGPMETLVIGYDHPRQRFWGYINVARTVFEEAYPNHLWLRREHRAAQISIPTYSSAGFDQLQIYANGLDALAALLRNTAVQAAARTLSLRLMRKSPTWYGRYHCFQLADRLL